MRNIQNINIRYGSGVPVPCDPSKLESMLKGNKKNNENLKNLCAFLDIEIGETK